MIGKTVSHYRIVDKLGEGGMGVVYRAEDTRLKRFVALKFLPPELTRDAVAKERFIQEAQAASALEHKNICNIHEIDETDDGQLYIVMACYGGETLKQKIERAPLDIDEAIDIAHQMAGGLARAHEKGIVHRDVKSANTIVTADGEVKIMDFGLAKLAGGVELTKAGTTLGTTAYMSPEAVRGEKVDQRTDIWSLGVVLYEMITGVRPFWGDYEQAVVYSILHQKHQKVSDLRSDVPAAVVRIIDRCLAKNTSERYPDLEGVIDDLELIRSESRDGAPPGGRHAGQKIKPHVLAAVVAFIVVLAGAGLLLFSPKDEMMRKRLVVLPFENLGPAETQYFAAGVTEEITSRLAMVSGLGVISRTSAVQYSNTEKTTKMIGDELGVDYVLEGTVRWSQLKPGSSMVRITPQLIRIDDDTHLWAGTYDRVLDDIFEIQTEIARNVAQALDVTLLESEHKAVSAKPTQNLEAYQAYLQGHYYAGQPHFSLKDWYKALQSYQRAVQLDPGFALAHAELSRAHARLYYFRHDLSEERRSVARAAAEKALELAPESPEVHLALGYYHFWVARDYEAALGEFEIAGRDLPESAEVFYARAELFRAMGEWERAFQYYQRACELSPRYASYFAELAITAWWMRRYPEALTVANEAIALAPDQAWPYLTKAYNYWSWMGALDEARAALEGVPLQHTWAIWAWYWQEVYEGNYAEALDRLTMTDGDWISLKTWARPKSLMSAHVFDFRGEDRLYLSACDSARILLEPRVLEQPDDPRYHSSLGIAYAGLGLRDEAVREGRRAVELLPVSKDAAYGIPYVIDLAHIFTILGEHDAAIAELENLLSVPNWISVPLLKIDPRWNPLRSHARFIDMLRKFTAEDR